MESSIDLQPYFPKSNPKATFLEVVAEYELDIPVWLFDLHTQQEFDDTVTLATQIFEDIFKDYSKPIIIMINHSDMKRDTTVLDCFQAFNKGDFVSKVFIDENLNVEKEQIYIETPIGEINYMDILEAIVQRDYYQDYKLTTSRVFFIHPDKQMYFLYSDYEVMVGANDLDHLKPLFNKYKEYMELAEQEQFLAQK